MTAELQEGIELRLTKRLVSVFAVMSAPKHLRNN
jgi:hypothetical protein